MLKNFWDTRPVKSLNKEVVHNFPKMALDICVNVSGRMSVREISDWRFCRHV